MNGQIEEIKHPLENAWNFWFYTNKNKKNWELNLVQLTTFETVEDYWCLYHHMKLPSELEIGQEYAIFRQNIAPKWEDNANKTGGRWCINVPNLLDMDRVWLDIILLMIGENFGEYNQYVTGAFVHVVQIKSRRKIAVWTGNAQSNVNLEIGKIIKKTLNLNFNIHYFAHKSTSVLYTV